MLLAALLLSSLLLMLLLCLLAHLLLIWIIGMIVLPLRRQLYRVINIGITLWLKIIIGKVIVALLAVPRHTGRIRINVFKQIAVIRVVICHGKGLLLS